MSGEGRRFFSGETEAQAVLEASAAFGLPPGELAFERKQGNLRRGRVVIAVDPAQPRRAPAAAAAPARTAAAARPEGGSAQSGGASAPRPAAAASAAKGSFDEGFRAPSAPPLEAFSPAAGVTGAAAVVEALAALADLELAASATVAAGDDGDEIRVDIRGADAPTLIADNGELLGAAEYLLRRMVRDLPPGGLLADSGGFQAERLERLRGRAAAAAADVRRTGEAFLFEPLPAAERRILHLVIRGEAGVASESEGDGELRRVRVAPDPSAG